MTRKRALRVTLLRVTLSDSDLTEAVTEWAERNGLMFGGPVSVAVEVETVTVGYGLAERDEHVGRVVMTEAGP